MQKMYSDKIFFRCCFVAVCNHGILEDHDWRIVGTLFQNLLNSRDNNLLNYFSASKLDRIHAGKSNGI